VQQASTSGVQRQRRVGSVDQPILQVGNKSPAVVAVSTVVFGTVTGAMLGGLPVPVSQGGLEVGSSLSTAIESGVMGGSGDVVTGKAAGQSQVSRSTLTSASPSYLFSVPAARMSQLQQQLEQQPQQQQQQQRQQQQQQAQSSRRMSGE